MANAAPPTKPCRFCQAPVYVAELIGRKMEFDAEPVPHGTYVLSMSRGRVIATPDPAGNAMKLRVLHMTTCPMNAGRDRVQTDLVSRDLRAETEDALRKTMGDQAYEFQKKLTGGNEDE